jgi:hypothetical protein
MIKPILKYCISLYLVLGFIAFLLLKKDDGPLGPLLALSILIVIIVVVGLFLGMIISVLIRRPARERIFYGIGQALSFTLGASFFLYALFHNPDKRTNAELNEATIRNLNNNNSWPFILPAFDSLKLKFKSPDDLKLNAVTSFGKDSGYTVYFAYNLFNNNTKEYYSKYEVANGQAKLIQFNLNTQSSIDYLHVSGKQEELKDSMKKYERLFK